jgi:hypothetical protein
MMTRTPLMAITAVQALCSRIKKKLVVPTIHERAVEVCSWADILFTVHRGVERHLVFQWKVQHMEGLRPGLRPVFSAQVSGFPARGATNTRVCGFH